MATQPRYKVNQGVLQPSIPREASNQGNREAHTTGINAIHPSLKGGQNGLKPKSDGPPVLKDQQARLNLHRFIVNTPTPGM